MQRSTRPQRARTQGGNEDPAPVYARPLRYRGKLAWRISLHMCLNCRSKSCEKVEGTAHLKALPLTVLLESGEIGQKSQSVAQSLFRAFPKGPPQASSSTLHPWLPIRSAGGRNKGTLLPSHPASSDWRHFANSPGLGGGGSRSSFLLHLERGLLICLKVLDAVDIQLAPSFPAFNIYWMICFLKSGLLFFIIDPPMVLLALQDGWLVCSISCNWLLSSGCTLLRISE